MVMSVGGVLGEHADAVADRPPLVIHGGLVEDDLGVGLSGARPADRANGLSRSSSIQLDADRAADTVTGVERRAVGT